CAKADTSTYFGSLDVW
nr:immunoglobulin heavy chain junction region [Macaca mulatta]